MFLTIEDYQSVCDSFEFEQVTASEAERLKAERAAMEKICSYTRHRYDMRQAFAAEGEQRNAMLVQCMVNITLLADDPPIAAEHGARKARMPVQ